MSSNSVLSISTLSKNQQVLLTKMSHLYEQNKDSQKYLNDILSGKFNLEPNRLTLHMASIAFNTNIISGKTTSLISKTIVLGDQNPPIYCYGLTGRPWEFVVHATVYNFPVALIDIRNWRLYTRDIIAGFTIELPLISLQLILHTLNSNIKRKESIFKKTTNILLQLNILFWRLAYLIVYFPLRLFRMRQRGLVSHILEILGKATPLLSLNHDIQSGENLDPIENSYVFGLVSKDYNNFGHYIWNDALGIVTTNSYTPLLKTHFLIEGPWDFVNATQLLNTPVSTFKLSRENLFNGYWCSYPVLALRAFPVLRSATSQLAIQLTNGNTVSNSILTSSAKTHLIQSSSTEKTNSPLYVVFTLRLGGRPWLNSLEAVETISHFLVELNPHIYFLIDGMTKSSDMQPQHIETMRSEVTLSSQIQRMLQENGYNCHVITGLDLPSKMTYYNLAGLFIQPLGSANILPSWILQKPLIYFGPSRMISLAEKQNSVCIDRMAPHICLSVVMEPGNKGYTLDPRHVVDAIKGSKQFMAII